MPTNRESKTSKTGNGSVSGVNDGVTNGGTTTPGIFGGIKQNVTARADEQKNRAADGLGGIANVIRSASNELRTENEALASYVDQASDQLKRFADQIRQKGVADMLDDVHLFARRRPALFIGGAFLVGVALARFLKSSADRYEYGSESNFSSVDPMTTQSVPSYGSGYGETGGY